MILALLVLVFALLAIFWTEPHIEHFELWLIVGLALAILLGGGWPNWPNWRAWVHRPPPKE